MSKASSNRVHAPFPVLRPSCRFACVLCSELGVIPSLFGRSCGMDQQPQRFPVRAPVAGQRRDRPYVSGGTPDDGSPVATDGLGAASHTIQQNARRAPVLATSAAAMSWHATDDSLPRLTGPVSAGAPADPLVSFGDGFAMLGEDDDPVFGVDARASTGGGAPPLNPPQLRG